MKITASLIKPAKGMAALVLVAIALVFVHCKKKDKDPVTEEPAHVFDKQAMLVNLADNVILPCYNEFKKSLDSLSEAFSAFKTSGSSADFQLVKQKYGSAYLKFQRINLYGFGPGEDQGMRINFDIFPCDTADIKANIVSGTYNLASASNVDAKGFPALDYLFTGPGHADSTLIRFFKQSLNRRQYVTDLLADMSQRTNAVLSAWNNGYRSTFVSSLSTDVSSSIGFVVNQLNFELDYLKNAKIATPLGLRSDGTPRPYNSEAYFSRLSLPYAIETLNTMENVFLGRSFAGSNGKGFDDYLDHLGAQYAGGSLTAAINSQFAVARAKLNAIAGPLSEKVISNPTIVNDAYKELVKLLVLLKTDMPSNLGVVITYQDGDGD